VGLILTLTPAAGRAGGCSERPPATYTAKGGGMPTKTERVVVSVPAELIKAIRTYATKAHLSEETAITELLQFGLSAIAVSVLIRRAQVD
jgi:hypothetical protein